MTETATGDGDATWPAAGLAMALSLLPGGSSEALRVVDVGAHRGETLRSVVTGSLRQVDYVALEPNPESFQILKQVASELGGAPNTVRCVASAVGDTDGFTTFLVTRASAVAGVLTPARGLSSRVPTGDHEIDVELDVPMVRVDTLLETLGIQEVDLLKIDTEGYDLRVLEGSTSVLERHAASVVLVEGFFVAYREDQCYFWDIAQFLHRLGYYFVGLFDTRNTSQGRLYTGNGLWASQAIADSQGYL